MRTFIVKAMSIDDAVKKVKNRLQRDSRRVRDEPVYSFIDKWADKGSAYANLQSAKSYYSKFNGLTVSELPDDDDDFYCVKVTGPVSSISKALSDRMKRLSNTFRFSNKQN